MEWVPWAEFICFLFFTTTFFLNGCAAGCQNEFINTRSSRIGRGHLESKKSNCFGDKI